MALLLNADVDGLWTLDAATLSIVPSGRGIVGGKFP
jgi:hypothetical protein